MLNKMEQEEEKTGAEKEKKAKERMRPQKQIKGLAPNKQHIKSFF